MQPLQGFLGRPIDDLELHRRERIGFAGAEEFFVECRQFFPMEWSIALDHHEHHRMGAAAGIPLLAAHQRAVDFFAGLLAEAERAVGRQRRFGMRDFGFWVFGLRTQELLQFRQKRLAAAAEFDFLQVALAVEHAVGQRLFVGQRVEHALLDGVFGHEVDHGHGPRLVFAPGAGDALLQFGRVPWQIAVDHDACVLQV